MALTILLPDGTVLAAGAEQPHRDVVGLLRLGGLDTVPDRMTPSPMPSTVMSASGKTCLIACANAVEIARDRDIEAGDLLALASKKNTLVCPTAMPMM